MPKKEIEISAAPMLFADIAQLITEAGPPLRKRLTVPLLCCIGK